MHFNLVRLFGRVPYVTTPVYSSDQIISPAREEVNAVYQKLLMILINLCLFLVQTILWKRVD